MKTKMVCIVANQGDVRFAPINDPGNDSSVRGLDLTALPAESDRPAFVVGDVYEVTFIFRPVGG